MDIMDFIKPELFVLIPVLYFIGIGFKNTDKISDNFIPLLLGFCGIALALIWVLSTTDFISNKDIFNAIFTSIVQGVICAGLSVYCNQIYKQFKKPNESE